MGTIRKIIAREILDSRGQPTLEAEIVLTSGHTGRGIVPSGASTGSKEALELRDRDKTRFQGLGVQNVVDLIKTEIEPALIGQSILEQETIDNIMINLDGTENKSRLGANGILAVSLGCARAASNYSGLPFYRYINKFFDNKNFSLPTPMMNIINGGAHADNNVDFQEFMIVPNGFNSFKESVRAGAEVFMSLKKYLKQKGLNTNVGDEGGFAPNLNSNKQAIDIILEVINQAGFKVGAEISLALDLAANEFHRNNVYDLQSENLKLNNHQFIDFLDDLVAQYPIISIEDPLYENDWQGWQFLTERLGHKIQIVGDDLFVTNKKLLQYGIDTKTANAILIKMNQIGTITETFTAIQLAKRNDYKVIISHRSGETEDTSIADLSVGSGACQIKTGSLSRSDRTAKYNQLIRIEEELLSGRITC